MILCTYEFVDLGMVTIFRWGLAYVEWITLLLGSISLCPATTRNQACWMGCPGCQGKIALCVPKRLASVKRCAFAQVTDGVCFVLCISHRQLCPS